MNKKVYLCGPINGRTDEDCKDWRESFKQLWNGETLDPMRRDYRGREHDCVPEIVAGDLLDISECGAIVRYFDKPSEGSAMETFYAKRELGLYIVVIDVSGKPLSPWLLHHSDAVVKSVEEAVKTLSTRFGQ